MTKHKIFYENANNMHFIDDNTVDLVVTSPPYPMIEMWDDIFIDCDPSIKDDLESASGKIAFEKMNVILDLVWSEVDRITKPGGIVCINIGDATRTLNKNFSLYPSHQRIIDYFYSKDFFVLPEILWHKQTNAPNKFMGSGMLPVGAYTTLEHEYILIFRKGNKKREFKSADDKDLRRSSAFFWEERNEWFSDIWHGVKGTGQKLSNENLRGRSAAYPFGVPYRLINMFSVKGDTVCDPYLGTGTTSMAAMVAGRNSYGIEIVKDFRDVIECNIIGTSQLVDDGVVGFGNSIICSRLDAHRLFIDDRVSTGKIIKYKNNNYDFPVVSKQEEGIYFNKLESIHKDGAGHFEIKYDVGP